MKKNLIIFLSLLLFSGLLFCNQKCLTAKDMEGVNGNCAALVSIIKSCDAENKAGNGNVMFVPGAWLVTPQNGISELREMNENGKLIQPIAVNPYLLIKKSLKNIISFSEAHPNQRKAEKLRTGKGIIAMNSLPRVLTMYDLDQNGIIGSSSDEDITLNSKGQREMGTFIKNILALPYIKALGFNTIHLQPVTEIGVYGRKGNLGSPFAIRDPFKIDSNLADPLFGQTVNEQYLAFIQATHALGMNIIQEVIPRTVSIDSEILLKNPEFGYWVKDGCPKRMPDYFNPEYEYNTLSGKRKFSDRASFETWFYGEYRKKIYSGKYKFDDLIDVTKTDPQYTGFFMPSPDIVKREPNGKLKGYYYKADSKGLKMIDESISSEVFPAFCDTPFEIQPFWQDVTYLRLYDDINGDMPVLKPLSFVTAKFFKDVEPEIEKKYRNKPVWDMITGYFNRFKLMGVDAFVLDMGHALPDDLKKDIKKVLPNVWEENLGVGFPYLAKTPVVITGNVFAYAQPSYNEAKQMRFYEENPERTVNYHIHKMKKLFSEASMRNGYSGKMFGFPDNYNTKRIGQTPAARDLKKAPPIEGMTIPDFTLAPVDKNKAKRITLLYYTIFRVLSETGDSPFLFNPVSGTEFIATDTINVGLSTHIKEAKQFYEYMTPEKQKENPEAPRLLLMSKPEKTGGEWSNRSNIIGRIIDLNDIVASLKPLLKKNIHLEVIPSENSNILFMTLTAPGTGGEKLAIVSNLNLESEACFTNPYKLNRYYLNKPRSITQKGKKGSFILPPGAVTLFTYN